MKDFVWIVDPSLTFFSGSGGSKFRKKLNKFSRRLIPPLAVSQRVCPPQPTVQPMTVGHLFRE